MAPLSHACDIEGTGDDLYSRFFSIAYEPTNSNEPAADARILSLAEAELAYSCLIQAASQNSCEAHYVLSLYYQDGDMGTNLPIAKNPALAEQYKDSSKELCSDGT